MGRAGAVNFGARVAGVTAGSVGGAPAVLQLEDASGKAAPLKRGVLTSHASSARSAPSKGIR